MIRFNFLLSFYGRPSPYKRLLFCMKSVSLSTFGKVQNYPGNIIFIPRALFYRHPLTDISASLRREKTPPTDNGSFSSRFKKHPVSELYDSG